MKKLTARWVPRMLMLAQKQQRTVLYEQNLTNFRADKKLFIERYVTMVQTWIHHYDPETKIQSIQWKHKGSPTPKKFKVLPSAGKVLLSVSWDAQGVIMVDYLQRGATITGLYYADLIHKLQDAIEEKCHGKLRRNVLLHQDNTPSHKSLIAMAAISTAGF